MLQRFEKWLDKNNVPKEIVVGHVNMAATGVSGLVKTLGPVIAKNVKNETISFIKRTRLYTKVTTRTTEKG